MTLLSILRRCGLLSWLSILACLAPCANAGSISFGLSLNGSKLTLTNQGNSTAFYPTVLNMLSDGHWEPLALPPGVAPPAELLPGAQLDLVWSDARTAQSLSHFEFLRPVMVRFYDQAGSGFGQISFFNQPPMSAELLDTGYVDGVMTINPPNNSNGKRGNAIHASWLLWPQEEGIAPLHFPVRFEFKQPPAQRIEWRSGMEKIRLDLGAGQPTAMLLHETDQGYFLQNLIGGGLQGRQQRAAWLDANALWIPLSELLAVAAVIMLAWAVIGVRRKEAVP